MYFPLHLFGELLKWDCVLGFTMIVGAALVVFHEWRARGLHHTRKESETGQWSLPGISGCMAAPSTCGISLLETRK